VSADDIGAHLKTSRGSDDQRLAALQGSLKCGTNCGSCIPELRRLVRAQPSTGHVLQVA
jgi:assimilatory nitrate reductase catalytic subunit